MRLIVSLLLLSQVSYGSGLFSSSPPKSNTYSATVIPSTSIAANATDVCTIAGSANKKVKVLKIELQSTQTTAGINLWQLILRSTLDSGGAASALPMIGHDQSGSLSAGADVLKYTANPGSLGSAVGTLRNSLVLSPAPASVANGVYVWDFDTYSLSQPVILNGVNSSLALNFNQANVPAGASVGCTFIWSEE